MRIAFLSRIIVEHGIAGGMEQHGRSLCDGLAARGHAVVTITTAHPRGLRETEGPGGRVVYVPAHPGRYSRAWDRWSWEVLRAEHARAPFDVILSQSFGALALIEPALRQLGLPTLVVLHGTLGGEWRTRRQGLLTPLGILRAVRFVPGALRQLAAWRRHLGAVAGWIAVSGTVRDAWCREMGLPPERVRVVYNGVDTARFRPDPPAGAATRAALDLAPGAPLLLGVGRLVEAKGYHVAVEALRRTRPRTLAPTLALAGDGRHRGRLERQAAAAGVAARFLGPIPNQDVPAYLAAADLFLMPTLSHESFPVSVVEALSCGVPALASRAGGVPEAIDDGATGLLLPMGDAGAWARAVDGLLDDARRRRAMGALARQVAAARFSRDAMVAAVEGELRRVAT